MDQPHLPEHIEPRPPLTTYESLAQMVDYTMLRPDLDDQQVHDGCGMARAYGVASVVVQPSNADLAVRLLEGSGVAAGSVVGFPHGGATTAVKVFEARDLLRRGVREIDMVLNIGKLRSRQFQYVESEVLQVANACHESGAQLKAILECGLLSEDLKVIAIKICKRAEADFVATSTGTAPSGSAREDLPLLKKIAKDVCRVKDSGPVDDLDAALDAYALGCDRVGVENPVGILDAWRARLAAQEAAAKAASASHGS